jgi:hypothetical protein
VACAISTLASYVEFNSTTGLYERRPYLGARQAGNYRTNRGAQVDNDYSLRVFYISKVQIGGVSVPASHYHNRDAANNKILAYSLAMLPADGIAQSFHTAWQTIRDGMQIVKTTVFADAKILKEMEDSSVYAIDAVQYLPYKLTRTLPLTAGGRGKGAVTQELVPL